MPEEKKDLPKKTIDDYAGTQAYKKYREINEKAAKSRRNKTFFYMGDKK